MNDTIKTQTNPPSALLVAAGRDRFGEDRGLGISTISLKLAGLDSHDIFIIENTFREKGGPARHLHYFQDEWFFVVEGEFTDMELLGPPLLSR